MTWKESGAWLNAIPVTSLCLKMADKFLRIAVGLSIGSSLVQSYVCCHCGQLVDVNGTHGLSCHRSQCRYPGHTSLNAVVKRSLDSARIPTRLEPNGC